LLCFARPTSFSECSGLASDKLLTPDRNHQAIPKLPSPTITPMAAQIIHTLAAVVSLFIGVPDSVSESSRRQ
jgi:hypothetical protein